MNYGQVGGTAATAAALPATGGLSIWYVIAAVALIGAGACVMRFVPKKQH